MATIIRDQPDRLYELLPTFYREADAEQGYPLRAMLRLIGDQANLVREDVWQLWDNFFIETCARWSIPYIGELVSNNLLHDIDLAPAAHTAESLFPDLAGPNLRPSSRIRTRADVARTIYYRRRKGTPAMLEELARDVTGWAAHVVEFFELLTWTQNLNHLRMHSPDGLELRRVEVAERVHGPFDPASHTVDVRRIEQFDGWYNIRNVGFFLWRLNSYPLRSTRPRAIAGTNWRFTFSPLGNSTPLFVQPRVEMEETGLATELHVPAPIRPAAFFEDMRAAHALTPVPATTQYYGDPASGDTSVVVFENGAAVSAASVRCSNLSNWTAFAQPNDALIRIDPARGRLIRGALRSATATLTASWFYGFSADMGGGPYERGKWLLPTDPAFTVGPTGTFATLNAALAAWALNPVVDTVITILDDATYAITNPITLDSVGRLIIQARNGVRPHIRPAAGVLSIVPGLVPAEGAELTLNGLLIEGGINVTQDLRRLRILHSTLVPGRSIEEENALAPSGVAISAAETLAGNRINADLRVEIAFSITGPIRLPTHATGLWILDSIVDGTERVGQPRVAAISNAAGDSAPPATIERSTILGESFFLTLPLASESIFTGDVAVERRQDGCVRFSFVTVDSVTPRQYRCQPATEIEANPTLAAEIEQWLVPSFTSLIYGQPAYAQLRLTAPVQIREGAEDGSEMGAFNHLKQPQRETNLRVRLDEYLPIGLEAGIIYVT